MHKHANKESYNKKENISIKLKDGNWPLIAEVLPAWELELWIKVVWIQGLQVQLRIYLTHANSH